MRPDAATASTRSLSRLRLRLAGTFSITFIAALACVAVFSLGWLWRESTRRLDRRLASLTESVSRAVRLEKQEYPDSGLGAVVADVHHEWVVGPDAWLLFDATGSLMASTADSAHTRRVVNAFGTSMIRDAATDLVQEDDDLRMVTRHIPATDGVPSYTLVAIGSTEGIERDTELLLLTLSIAAPLIAMLSLGSGYVLSRWALRPADRLGEAIDALGPAVPSARLPIAEPTDEIGELAQRFNALLDRLAVSQRQNRDFVREAAHQIRTPLTLVRGEAEHGIAMANPDVTELQATLSRIDRASRQMQRRVDELLLLAEAEAGARLEQRAPVELDALALEGVDLFRARAAQVTRSLAFGVIEPTTVLGDEALLREALLELLENACRHGETGTCITVSVRQTGDMAELFVESARATPDHVLADTASTGLGLRIVRWIAEVHDGQLTNTHDPSEHYTAILRLPAVPSRP